MAQPFLLISACLCGIPCRYNGTAASVPELEELVREGSALTVCPERDAGLPTPRPPCELRSGRVVTEEGDDLTDVFRQGALKTLETAKKNQIRLAVLKERSPSCGSSLVYDGTFSGSTVEGKGLTARLLSENGVQVVSERNYQAALPAARKKQNEI